MGTFWKAIIWIVAIAVIVGGVLIGISLFSQTKSAGEDTAKVYSQTEKGAHSVAAQSSAQAQSIHDQVNQISGAQ